MLMVDRPRRVTKKKEIRKAAYDGLALVDKAHKRRMYRLCVLHTSGYISGIEHMHNQSGILIREWPISKQSDVHPLSIDSFYCVPFYFVIMRQHAIVCDHDHAQIDLSTYIVQKRDKAKVKLFIQS